MCNRQYLWTQKFIMTRLGRFHKPRDFKGIPENRWVIENDSGLSLTTCHLSVSVHSRQNIQVPPFLSKGSLWVFPSPLQWRWWRWAHHCRRAGGVRTACCCVRPSPTTRRSPERNGSDSSASVSSPSPRRRGARLFRFHHFLPWPRRCVVLSLDGAGMKPQ